MSFVEQRCERLNALLTEEGVDACLISNPIHVTYLTGFTGDSSYFIASPERSMMVSDSRYTVQIQEECPGLNAHIRTAEQTPLEALTDTLRHLGYRKLGFESGHLTVAQMEQLRDKLPELDWHGASSRVEKLRMVKDASELKQIREAISIAQRAYTVLCALLSPEQTELELCHSLEHYVHQAGGRGMAFPSIVAVGERAALPHATPTEKKVEESDLLLVDWGASGPLYKSDLTRVIDTRRSENSTSAGANESGPTLESIYRIVRKAQESAIEKVRPGVKAVEVDTAARQVIADSGYGDYFGHGLGHGFGLEIHEGPSLRPHSETVLEEGMVFTIEPGIYLPGWGGVRLEDDILVTENGYEVLTSAPKDLIRIFDR